MNNNISKYKKLLLPALCVIVIVTVLVSTVVGSSRSLEETIDIYVNSYMTGDAEAIFELLPKSYVNSSIQSGRFSSEDAMIAIIQNTIDYVVGCYESDVGGSFTYTYRVELNREQPHLIDYYTYTYDYGSDAEKIKEARSVLYYLALTSPTKTSSPGHSLNFLQINNDWYLASLDDMLRN